jgi:hypothetical protein
VQGAEHKLELDYELVEVDVQMIVLQSALLCFEPEQQVLDSE